MLFWLRKIDGNIRNNRDRNTERCGITDGKAVMPRLFLMLETVTEVLKMRKTAYNNRK